ncbi:undecaprenyl-diphosphatase [Bacillus sp. SCS-153A]|uniref:undecaprenyl-diphosphatase n=1 Tax=Rossellomorea sedimentorum TaxID=3115294 RepID=UPI0039063857
MDVRLFWAINSLSKRTDFLNLIMIFFSNRIRYVYFFVLLILFFKNKSITFNAVISAVASMIFGSIIRLFSFRARPFVKNRVGILIPSKRNSSFPSKHTMLTFAVSTTLCLYNRTLGGIFTCLSALTGLSRVWVGHHYPSDIIGSALIGSFTSLLTRFLTINRQSSD